MPRKSRHSRQWRRAENRPDVSRTKARNTPPASTQKHTLILRAKLSEIAKVERFLRKLNRTVGLDEVEMNKLMVATTEAVSNSIIHGSLQNADKKVHLTCEIRPRTLIVRVRDEGKGFDLTKVRNPLQRENLMRVNGRGIFLMRTLMDKVEYQMTKNGVEVTMKMRLSR